MHSINIIITLISITAIILYFYFNVIKKEGFYSYSNVIPKVIVSTYHKKNKIPEKVFLNIRKYASNYKYLVFNDNEIISFLNKYYNNSVVETFNNLKGPHKADLFRYCYLYKFGGIYLDIKTELIENIDNIFNKRNVHFYTVISGGKFKNTIYQGIIATVPSNPFFLNLINFMINIKKPVKYYQTFTKDFYKRLEKEYKIGLKSGFFRGKYNLYLFNEKCTKNSSDCKDGLDRYGRCCFIYDNKKIIKTRYSDYPW